MPKYLVIDNFPAAVVGTDPLHPHCTQGFPEYAQYRGFIPDPARAGHLKDKPKVPYARERFFKDADFIRFSHADDFFKAMSQARVDNSVDRAFRSFLTPDLLILDDLGLHRLTAQQSADLYELILNRHRSSSFIITSNRAIEEWLSLFDDPILGNSALDRLANASYQIVIEGTSYRERLSPHRALLSNEGGD